MTTHTVDCSTEYWWLQRWGVSVNFAECRRDAMVGKEQWRTPLLSVGL